jgi:hypothetical protein
MGSVVDERGDRIGHHGVRGCWVVDLLLEKA